MSQTMPPPVFDPFAPGFTDDPYPQYAALRTGAPGQQQDDQQPHHRQHQAARQPDPLAVALALRHPRRGRRRDQPREQEVQRIGANRAAHWIAP